MHVAIHGDMCEQQAASTQQHTSLHLSDATLLVSSSTMLQHLHWLAIASTSHPLQTAYITVSGLPPAAPLLCSTWMHIATVLFQLDAHSQEHLGTASQSCYHALCWSASNPCTQAAHTIHKHEMPTACTHASNHQHYSIPCCMQAWRHPATCTNVRDLCTA
jgi:hypothetical protein